VIFGLVVECSNDRIHRKFCDFFGGIAALNRLAPPRHAEAALLSGTEATSRR
jgi:hypothetical protein